MAAATSSAEPAPRTAHRRAIRAYQEGEALCDAGRAAEGMKQLAAAFALAPELDADPWPAWAETLYAAGVAAPPLLAEDTTPLQPELAPHAGAGAAAWLRPEACASVREALARRHFALLDGFLDASAVASLRFMPRSRPDARASGTCRQQAGWPAAGRLGPPHSSRGVAPPPPSRLPQGWTPPLRCCRSLGAGPLSFPLSGLAQAQAQAQAQVPPQVLVLVQVQARPPTSTASSETET